MDRKIIDYTVLSQDSDVAMDKNVLYYMERGRQPLGGISVHRSMDFSIKWLYSQAMVKYEPLPSTEK